MHLSYFGQLSCTKLLTLMCENNSRVNIFLHCSRNIAGSDVGLEIPFLTKVPA
jgi:hypothetical protein